MFGVYTVDFMVGEEKVSAGKCDLSIHADAAVTGVTGADSSAARNFKVPAMMSSCPARRRLIC